MTLKNTYENTNFFKLAVSKNKLYDLIENHTTSDEQGIKIVEKNGKFALIGTINGYKDGESKYHYYIFLEKLRKLLPEKEVVILQTIYIDNNQNIDADVIFLSKDFIRFNGFVDIIEDFKAKNPEYNCEIPPKINS